MFIEIKGVQFINKGAELMLMAVIEQLNSNFDSFSLVLEPNNKSPYLDRIKLGAYQKLNLRKRNIDLNWLSYKLPKPIRRVLKNKWGVITESDIDIILDASGFAYGDQWGEQSIINMCKEIDRLSKSGKKYIFLPQALGPFTRDKSNSFMKNSLPKASLICARESKSFKNINELTQLKNIEQHGDFTNLLSGERHPSLDLENVVLIVPNSNMASSRNNNQGWHKSYVDVMISSVDSVIKLGLKPMILNHEGEADDYICKEISEKFDNKIKIIYEKNPLIVKGIIGDSKAIICSRFHGCVSALSQGVPCLGTSWSHKYEKLFEEYSRSDYLLTSNVSGDKIESLLVSSISSIQDENYLQAIEQFKANSKDMWTSVFNII